MVASLSPSPEPVLVGRVGRHGVRDSTTTYDDSNLPVLVAVAAEVLGNRERTQRRADEWATADLGGGGMRLKGDQQTLRH